jgi:hypothetical protein
VFVLVSVFVILGNRLIKAITPGGPNPVCVVKFPGVLTECSGGYGSYKHRKEGNRNGHGSPCQDSGIPCGKYLSFLCGVYSIGVPYCCLIPSVTNCQKDEMELWCRFMLSRFFLQFLGAGLLSIEVDLRSGGELKQERFYCAVWSLWG